VQPYAECQYVWEMGSSIGFFRLMLNVGILALEGWGNDEFERIVGHRVSLLI